MREDNTLVMAHVEPSGELSHPPARVPLGRYGSGHGAIARPDRRSHVITYPREGPRGVRNAYVSALDATGALGPERMLGEDGDQLALPVRLGERLVVVHHGDALVLQVTDVDSLELLERFVGDVEDAVEARAVVGLLGDAEPHQLLELLREGALGGELGAREHLGDHTDHHLEGVDPPVRQLARHDLVQQDPKRVRVGRFVVRLAT